ncbi:MAG TPA: zinc-ribbon domain-containing protein [Planctomycetes bacterium]|nr:zinc-ribbon domain-containing protein [Planctomycetaceae bacterium]HIM29064.1 zinc-ribbon domain-containing protein [Planctomycetota bacterium]
MILYGTTSLTLTGSRGQFYCPRCSGQSDYKQKDVRRFFTLYFIPLIPLNVIETYLECVGCKGRFAMDALHLNKDDYERKSQDAFAQLLLRAMLLIMIADGTVDDAELNEVERLHAANAKEQTISRVELTHQITMATQAKLTVVDFLNRVSGHLSDEQKNEVIRCCFLVSTVAGELRTEQMRQLEQLPAAMGIAENRFREIIEGADQP